jgi:predicted TIM-barrel fold metal-dependent hydrolase
MYNAFKRITKDYSASERADMFHDVAAKVYRVDV